jgi:hypothetical protein
MLPPKVQLVTSNPVGRSNMRAALESVGYSTADGFNFVNHMRGFETHQITSGA